MAARKKTYRKKTAKRSRRRMRRNSYPIAGVAVNPRRRRRTYRRRHRRVMAANPRRRRRSVSRRTFRRNPSMFGGLLGGLPTIQTVLFTGVGFVGTPIVEGFANRFVPATITSNTIGKYAVRIASVIGLTFLVKTVIGSAEARPVAVGGGLYVATSAIAEFAPGIIPIPASMGAYARPALRAYAAPTKQLRATMGVLPRTSTNVPARFRRF